MAKLVSTKSKDLTTEETGVLDNRKSKSECGLSPEDIQINFLPENVKQKKNDENQTDQSENHGGARAKERRHSNRSFDNVPRAEADKRVIRRRIGIVEESDKVLVERRKARVLRKKFGEALIHETPWVFNKKL